MSMSGFYCTHAQRMFIMSANAQAFQSIHCFHRQMRDVDESLDQYFGIIFLLYRCTECTYNIQSFNIAVQTYINAHVQILSLRMHV